MLAMVTRKFDSPPPLHAMLMKENLKTSTQTKNILSPSEYEALESPVKLSERSHTENDWPGQPLPFRHQNAEVGQGVRRVETTRKNVSGF